MGHITTVNYPDGNQANYSYTNGVVSGLTLTMAGTTVNGATAISYQPMNLGMAAWTSSNGLVNTMGYDTDGRLTAIGVPGVQSLGFTYDNADRITQIGNGIDGTQTQYFGYDAMSRLVSVYSGVDNESFQYDANGNRLAQTGTTDTVSATSNQLLSSGTNQYGYDARGNTTTVNGAATYQYDAFNRMNAAAGMAYYVNPEGQRLRKTGTAGTTYFAPSQGGGLMAENPGGAWIDYVWLNGRLIGRIASGQADAIHDDQVGRPQVVTDPSHNIVWQAQNLAFSQNITTASITLNLGFPGQYYDAETAAWNNGFRDYKATLGRYVESDPMGLPGGINTYGYVGGNPLSYTDPYGLYTFQIGFTFTINAKIANFFGIAATGAYGAAFDTTGQIATYHYYGEGGTVGSGGIFVGEQLAWSNADTIQDLAGPFNAYNVTASDGPGGGFDYFTGKNQTGCKTVKGGGFAWGGGEGANAFVGQTTTGLGNVGHLW